MKKVIRNILISLFAGCLVGGILIFAVTVNADKPVQKNESDKGNAEDIYIENTEYKGKDENSTIAGNVLPAIVAINCYATEVQYDIFGRTYEYDTSGSGSGIIISQNKDDIYIVTNDHVVNGAHAIEVVFCDGMAVKAEIKGEAPDCDIAVIEVAKKDLLNETFSEIRIAVAGDSEAVDLGEKVIAIGNALGYGHSTTAGYVSALDREVVTEMYTMDLIQTDAAINPGNSGGALLNVRGELIGINSVKYSAESVEGIGYAIPINDAIPIIEDIINRRELSEKEKAYLGIEGTTVSENYAEYYNMPLGVYVNSVVEGSAADLAGIMAGDIITGINSRNITSNETLKDVLDHIAAGTDGIITVKRIERTKYVEVKLDITFDGR